MSGESFIPGPKRWRTTQEGCPRREDGSGPRLRRLLQNPVAESDDARVVYFVSNKALTGSEENSEGDQAEAGALNLYMYREGAGLTFVAVLAEFVRKFTPYTQLSYFRISRVSPDGGHLAFMSHAPRPYTASAPTVPENGT